MDATVQDQTPSEPADDLNRLRQEIETLDARLLETLNARARVSLRVGRLKARTAMPILQPAREASLLDALCAANPGPLPAVHLRAVYREILASSRALQEALRTVEGGEGGNFPQSGTENGPEKGCKTLSSSENRAENVADSGCETFRVGRSALGGAGAVTTSKSHTMRAILLASVADGVSVVRAALPSPDTAAMLTACRALGATIRVDGEPDKAGAVGHDARQGLHLTITGTAGRLHTPDQVIDVGNSGQVLRFGAALAALQPGYAVFTGDASIRHLRPMRPLLDALTQLGAFAESSKQDGHAPILIKGPVAPGRVEMDGADSQPVSAMLFLGAMLPGETEILVRNPGETPWIEMTLHWLDRLGIACQHEAYARYRVRGGAVWKAFDYTVPGDWSSAAFPLGAALITNSSITLRNMDIRDPQGDKAILDVFRRMGAVIHVDEAGKTLSLDRHPGLHGVEADVNALIDAVPILATVACFADSPTTLTGAAIARRKESDRLSAIAEELGKMGAQIDVFDDGLRIHPARLHGAVVESRHDHRIAMSLAVAGLTCGDTLVRDTACVAKSFPGFAAAMRELGAQIEEGRA